MIKIFGKTILVITFVSTIFFHNPSFVSAETMDSGKAFNKLTRGFINIITGWVEIPKKVQETTKVSGPATGFTWGLIKGFGYGFIRTVAGGYELITFPFPAPPNYDPIMEPEYVFSSDEADSYEYHTDTLNY